MPSYISIINCFENTRIKICNELFFFRQANRILDFAGFFQQFHNVTITRLSELHRRCRGTAVQVRYADWLPGCSHSSRVPQRAARIPQPRARPRSRLIHQAAWLPRIATAEVLGAPEPGLRPRGELHGHRGRVRSRTASCTARSIDPNSETLTPIC